jgi:LPXTG-motif cell wall-anchored protein
MGDIQMANASRMTRSRSGRSAVCAAALAAFLAGLSALPSTAFAALGTYIDDSGTVRGSVTDRNACNATLDPPAQPPGPVMVAVTISSAASPQPHNLDPVSLSHTTVEVTVPAQFVQAGIDAGIYSDGQTFPVTVSPVIAGSNTVEATHEYEASTTVTVRVVEGVARPLTATVQLPDTIWHPASRAGAILFTEQSARVVIALEPLSATSSVQTFECAPSGDRAFIALGGTEPTTTTQGPTTTSISDAPIVNQTTTVPVVAALPRTGSSSGYAVLFGLCCLAGGALLIGRRGNNWIH